MGNDPKECQGDRFVKAVRDSGADMTKEEFGRVIGRLAKPKPQAPKQMPDTDQEANDAS